MSDEELTEPAKDPSDSEDSGQPSTQSQQEEIEALGGQDARPDRELTRAEAAQLIDSLRHRTGHESD